MAISRVGFSSYASAGANGTQIIIPAVTGVQAGDLLIVEATFSRSGTLWAATSYTGWTLMYDLVDGSQFTRYLWRIADGSATDTPPTFTNEGTNAARVGICVAYRGVDNASPFLAEASRLHTEASATAHPATALTNTDAGAWGVYIAAARQVATPLTWSPGSGLTELVDNDSALGNTNNVAQTLADSNGTVAASTVTYTASTNTATATAVMWSAFLRPAAAAATFTGQGAATASSTGTGTGGRVAGGSGAATASSTGTGTGAVPASSPGQVLNVGSGVGQNHFDVQIAPTGGSSIEVHSQAEIAAGYTDPSHFYTSPDGQWVVFRPRADGPTTSGSTYARDELREVTAAGSNMVFDAATGEHTLQFYARIVHTPANDPDVVIAQLHDGNNDVIAVRTQMFSNGTTVLGVRFNGTLHATRLQNPWVPNSDISCKIRVFNSGAVEVYYGDMATPLISMPTGTIATATDPAGHYWKLGAYNQFNPTATGATGLTVSATEYSEVWHKAPTVVHASAVTTSGSGAATASSTGTGSGAQVRTGSGAATASSTGTGSGGQVRTGSGDGAASAIGSGSGAPVVAGGSGGFGYDFGTSFGSAGTTSGTGDAMASSTGTGTGAPILVGSGAGAASSTGSGTGARVASGSGNATASSTGSAVGSRVLQGQGGAVASSTGVGSGAPILLTPSGFGTASASSTGAGTGAPIRTGLGAGTASSTGSGSGGKVVLGSGGATMSSVAVGSGKRIVLGGGDADVTSTASGPTGKVVLTGLGAGTSGSTATGTGAPILPPSFKYHIGTTVPTKMYVGTRAVVEVYQGSVKVWP